MGYIGILQNNILYTVPKPRWVLLHTVHQIAIVFIQSIMPCKYLPYIGNNTHRNRNLILSICSHDKAGLNHILQYADRDLPSAVTWETIHKQLEWGSYPLLRITCWCVSVYIEMYQLVLLYYKFSLLNSSLYLVKTRNVVNSLIWNRTHELLGYAHNNHTFELRLKIYIATVSLALLCPNQIKYIFIVAVAAHIQIHRVVTCIK